MPRSYIYQDREDAGKKLAEHLIRKHFVNPYILGLPRGGIILAKIVARMLEAPLDVVIARKIGAPGHSELGIGAVSEDEIPYFAPEYSSVFDRNSPEVKLTVKREILELRRRIELYRNGLPLPSFSHHAVIVVDDGLATGVTAIAAGKFLRSHGCQKLILAVPLGPDQYSPDILKFYDEIICPFFLENMMSVGMWYREFYQVEDDEVLFALNRIKDIDDKFLERRTE